MFLLNLSFAELAALFSVISAGVFALYLFDRSRRRQMVATLRFWKPSEFPVQMNQRRKVQQPLSLILQILGIALLLLAIAQLKWGSRERNMRDHVLVLDTSAWMGAQDSRGGGLLMNDAKNLALAWLKSVPSDDRVMVLRADAAATPATRFERNKQTVEKAIRESQPAASALQLGQALRFAAEFQKLHSESSGEIVYAGAGRMADLDIGTVPANLRVLAVEGPADNIGLRRMGLRRSSTDPEAWDIFVSVKNYGASPRAVPIGLQFAGSPAGTRTLQLKPDAELETTFTYRTRANGIVEAKLLTSDPFPQDDRAVLEIPQQKQLRIAVYTNEPELLRPVLSANPNMAATFLPPSAYQAEPADADLMILDRFAPPQPPKRDALWIEPPAAQSPVTVVGRKSAAKLTRWTQDELLGAGLRTKDLEIEQSVTYRPAANDIVIAESDGEALIVARPGARKNVVIGFHPIRTRMRYELAAPLLFANTIRWMEPESFRRWQLNG
ncbi:MAG: VWA domain-containing protein, partial [Acidobacteria bacterium]|nr:VWA domain-containing protein [Acidobacteriota bacterium]